MITLVTVNGESIGVADALRRSIMHEEDFVNNTIEWMLIRQYAEQSGISNTDEELQVAVDEMRYQDGLESVEAAEQWLKSNNLTILAVQNGLDGMLLRNKVRNSIPDSEIEAHFAENQLDYETVELYSIRLDDEDLAQELYAQITEEGENFHLLAMEHSLDEETKHLGGYVGKLTRAGMTGEVEAAVFQAQPGEVIGPIKTEKGYNLFKVTDVHSPTLDEVRDEVEMTLFVNLLAKLRAEAEITYPVLEA